MNKKEFVDLFTSKISEGAERYSLSSPLLLGLSITDDVTVENQLDIKGRLAIKLIIAGVCLSDSLAALKAFDVIVEKFVLGEDEGKKIKIKP